MSPRRLLVAAAAALLLALQPNAPAAAKPLQQSSAGFEQQPLVIESRGRRHRFTVEIARTPKQQQLGLMFRRSLGPASGMVFPLQPPRPASFWMKNTLIPLDILFIRADGKIARVAAMTRPLSLEPIESGEPVAAVLEIAGGRAAALGIRAGDRVRWPA